MSILVIAEHDNRELKPVTLNVIQAASEIAQQLEKDVVIDLLIAGADCQAVAEQAAEIAGISKVLVADNPVYQHQLAENTSLLITALSDKYSHILAAATTTGKNVLPCVAALLDVVQLSDVMAVESANTFKRPIYAGNAIATVQSDEHKHVLTVRGTAFDGVAAQGNSAVIETVSFAEDSGLTRHVSDQVAESDRPELTSSRVVISGGRGMANGENFQLLDQVANKLGAAVGASRAAVDAGFVPNDMQVGQTGKIVAPELYIAVGISGAIQHLAGMKDSKVIVAINKDQEAPIFSIADYGLVADLFEALPELEQKL